MAVDDKRVKALIKKALTMYEGKTGGKVGDLAAALGYIIEARKGICENYEFAAADHYLNARGFVALTGMIGSTVLIPLIMAYDVAKVANLLQKELSGLNLIPSTDGDPCPPTGPSLGVMIWGMKGVGDGILDFNKIHGIPMLGTPVYALDK